MRGRLIKPIETAQLNALKIAVSRMTLEQRRRLERTWRKAVNLGWIR